MCPQLICVIGFGRLKARHKVFMVRVYFPWEFVKQSLTNQQLVFKSLETSTNLLGTG